jgi:hypothetical protein
MNKRGKTTKTIVGGLPPKHHKVFTDGCEVLNLIDGEGLHGALIKKVINQLLHPEIEWNNQFKKYLAKYVVQIILRIHIVDLCWLLGAIEMTHYNVLHRRKTLIAITKDRSRDLNILNMAKDILTVKGKKWFKENPEIFIYNEEPGRPEEYSNDEAGRRQRTFDIGRYLQVGKGLLATRGYD